MSTKVSATDEVSREVKPQETLLELREELLKDDVAARLKHVIHSLTHEKKRFPTLQKLTDIKESTWRTWWNRGGVPSGALVEAAAKAWPEYAFWLSTGLTDVDFGHRMPKPPVAGIGYVSNWPEGPYTSQYTPAWMDFDEGKRCPHLTLASEYFKICHQIKEAAKKDPGALNESLDILEHVRQYVIEKRRNTYAKKEKKSSLVAEQSSDD